MVNVSEQFTFENIIVPVLVAIATTLIVEYFAKPKLEARKARLIRDREQLDKIVFDFQHIALSVGAIPDYDLLKKNKILQRHYEIMLEEAKSGLYQLLKDLSKLSTRFVMNHKEHMNKTSLYIGYLLSQVELIQESDKKWGKPAEQNLKMLKEDASKMELFDKYFLVYPYLIDSQEKWYRRRFWQFFTQKFNSNQIDEYFQLIGVSKE